MRGSFALVLFGGSILKEMDESKQSSGKGIGANLSASDAEKSRPSKFGKNKSKDKGDSSSQEVLLTFPGGFQYRMPGKRQRVVLGSLVLGLNVLLVIAVLLYFYSPTFHDFVFNFGRE